MIRFGIVGTNWITERFLNDADTIKDFKLTAVYSRTEERAQAFAAKYNVNFAYTDLDQMAKSGEIDAVYIASPNSFHAAQTINFLKHGIHVLCEKPLASNAKEVEAMFNAAKERNTVLMEAMKSTLLPGFLAIQEHLHKIGPVHRYTSSFCRYTDRYDAYLAGELPNVFNPEYSTGSLMDLGVYCLYPLIVLFGEPKTVHAVGHLLESGTDGEGSLLLSYDTMDAVIMHSKITTSYLPTEIQGEKGTMVIDKISTPKDIEIRYHDGTTEAICHNDEPHPMSYEIKTFIDLIQSGQTESLMNSYKNSWTTAHLLELARKQLGIAFPADQ